MSAVNVHLTIERDESVPVPLVQVALDATNEDTGTQHIVVIGTNFEGDHTGAQAIALFLRTAADAIDGELVRAGHHPSGASVPGPTRPRFNPRPVVGR